MITIVRKYHFYAAHRNELLEDKCRNLHGHTYDVEVEMVMPYQLGDNGVTMLFSQIDSLVEPVIKTFDHATLIHAKDPLLRYLEAFKQFEKDSFLKLVVLSFPTSVENIAEWLYKQLIPLVPVTAVGVAETKSATVWYRP